MIASAIRSTVRAAVCCALATLLLSGVVARAADWPWWRGPQRDGHADAAQSPPTAWSETENVVWKTPLAGRGHGSPIVVGDQIVLATADEEHGSQWLLCFDRASGKPVWKAAVHESGAKVEGNKKASLASSTPACDGERLFINFLNDGAMYTSAVSRDGKLLWQTKIVDYTVHQGYGSSPAVFENLVLVSADNKG
ncbi:MAG: PQQ-binding-like beta-propeller repeat protein, partial [Planctomycetales bacterium]|nr:PQQ-binding-like beta-propeller repeat protein [Planctomycetales bacterium]